MERKIKTKDLKINTPYTQYQDTEEWIIIEHLLKELENNQDIELKTAPEYVIGYLVEKLRNKDLLLLEKTIKVAAKANNDREVSLRLVGSRHGVKKYL